MPKEYLLNSTSYQLLKADALKGLDYTITLPQNNGLNISSSDFSKSYRKVYVNNNGVETLIFPLKYCIELLDFLNSRLAVGSHAIKAAKANDTVPYDVLASLGVLYTLEYRPSIIGVGSKKGRVVYNKVAAYILKQYFDDRKQRLASNNNDIVPLIIRQAIYFVIYATLSAEYSQGANYSIVRDEVRKVNRYRGYEKELLNAIGVRQNRFDKWEIYPFQDFINETTPPAKLRIQRSGAKRDELLYTITRMINNVYPSRIIDVFGGTGTVTAALPQGKIKILNEFELFTWNFLDCVKQNAKGVLNCCRAMHRDLLSITDISYGRKRYNDVMRQRQEKLDASKDYSEYEDTDYDEIIKYADFYEKYQSYANKLLKKKERGKLDNIINCAIKMQRFDIRCRVAAVWYFLYSFKGNSASNTLSINNFGIREYPKWLEKIGYDQDSHFQYLLDKKKVKEDDYFHKVWKYTLRAAYKDQDSIIENPNLKFTNNNVELIEYGKRLKGVALRNEDFRDILDEADKPVKGATGKVIASPRQTVVYLDPPYFMTTQYDNAFPDSFHLAMLDWMRKTECKWILSCKETVTNHTSDDSYRLDPNDKRLIKDFKEYFRILQYGYTVKQGNLQVNNKGLITKIGGKVTRVPVMILPRNKSEKEVKRILKYISYNDCCVAKVIEDKSNILPNLYVYRNVYENNEQYDEIMITNFLVPEWDAQSFDLYWNNKIQDAEHRRKKVDKRSYDKSQLFFKREDYADFLSSLQ